MDVRRYAAWLLIAGLVSALQADQPGTSADEPTAKAVRRGVRLQPGDDVAEPIDSVRERSPEDEKRLDALSWLGLAKLRESRGDFRGAFDAYRKAAELDPQRVAIYRDLVPLAFSLQETDEGLKYALKLVDLNPDDAGLMLQVSRVLVTRGQVAEASSLLERAAQAAATDRMSPRYVAVQHDLGALYVAQGLHDKAADAFEVLIDALKNPEAYGLDARARAALLGDAEATYERLGQTFLEAGRVDPAIEAFEQAAAARRNRPGILKFDLARVYLKAEQPAKALEQLDAYVQERRTDRGRAAYDLLGKALAALDRESEFETRLRGILAEDPGNAHAKIVLAERQAAVGNLDDASVLYEQALEDLKDPAAFLGLAEVYRRQGKAAELVDRLARAAAAGAPDETLDELLEKVAGDAGLAAKILERGVSDAGADPPKLDFATAFLLGKIASKAERIDDAGTFYRIAARIRPDKAAEIYDDLGLALLVAERYGEAAEVYRKALDNPVDDGTKLNLLFRFSQALEFAGKTDDALATIDQALKIAPEAALLHYQRGWVHFHARRWDEAAELFRGVVERFPRDVETVRQARLSLSALYVELGETAKAEQVLEEVYASAPDDPSVNNDLGYLYADQGKKLDQAEAMIGKALRAEPENPAYLDSMGWVLHRLGRDEEAVVHLEKAVSLPAGNDATLWDHLGDVYDKLGRTEKAREAWRRAIENAKAEPAPKLREIQAIEDKLNRAAE